MAEKGLSRSTESQSPQEWKTCFRDNLFINKVAIITGGGTGIGLCITRELAMLGATVVIASRSVDNCQLAANDINNSLKNKSYGKVVVGPSLNIRKEDDVKRLVSYVIDTYGKINFLVNNAGGQYVSEASDISYKGFKAVVETNLIGTFLMCREVYNQYMKHSGCGGNIVNITLGNRNGFPLMSHSGSARAGIENLSITLSQEWIQSGVRINCIRPGIIYTESGFQNYGPMGDIFLSKVLQKGQPSKRLGTPEEISSATCWLLCDGSSYVTGAIIQVDGGSAYHAIPLLDIITNNDEDSNDNNDDDDDNNNNKNKSPALPIYGTLPIKARL